MIMMMLAMMTAVHADRVFNYLPNAAIAVKLDTIVSKCLTSDERLNIESILAVDIDRDESIELIQQRLQMIIVELMSMKRAMTPFAINPVHKVGQLILLVFLSICSSRQVSIN